MGRPANYRVVEDTPEKLVLEDLGSWGRHFTITNDAENVVNELRGRLQGRKLFYFDSEGELTEIDVERVPQ